jgi:beta-glucanase (GH16 family)
MHILISLLCLWTSVHSQQDDEYRLVFSDEFSSPTIDTTKWRYDIDCCGGGNLEKQCYVNDPEVLYLKDGFLHIKPKYYENGYQGTEKGCTDEKFRDQHCCTWTQPTTSARISTMKMGGWKYGKFEIRAKTPIGDYLWPSSWLLPENGTFSWAESGKLITFTLILYQSDLVLFLLK